jgi:hypothetical protein
MFMTKLNMGSGGNLEGVGLAEVALMMKRGNDTANILALMTKEPEREARRARGRPKPMK